MVKDLCQYACLVKAGDAYAFRDDVIYCHRSKESRIGEDLCIGTITYPTGHSRLGAYVDEEKILECLERKV